MKSNNWKRVALMTVCIALLGAISVVLPLLSKRQSIPMQVAAVDEPEEFQLTRGFATDNDREVLLAVLNGLCGEGKHLLMLSDKPIERADNRKQIGLDTFPVGIACSSVKIESAAKLEDAVSNCPARAKPDRPSTSSWPCFNYHYPNARGILTLSLPFYYEDKGIVASVESGTTCGWLCGSGRNYLLRKVDGKWKVVETIPTWIA